MTFKKGHIPYYVDGIPPSRKGAKLTEKTKEILRKLYLGKKRSEEDRRRISEGQKGRKLSQATKDKMRISAIKSRGHIIKKDTKIELKVEAELQKRNINYQKQVPLCNVSIVDFYLPEYRIIIQCDGDYWHNLPIAKIRDEKANKVLIFNGFNVYRFWEHEINKSVEECINKIIWLTKN